MSLFGDYIKEREGKEIIECQHGFMTYIFNLDRGDCYIEDCYVAPGHRLRGIGSTLLNSLIAHASAKGCKTLTTSIRPSTKGATDSMKAILAAGFKLMAAFQDAIFFKMEL
jgi:GNAT superfamily N-acetyltransferase